MTDNKKPESVREIDCDEVMRQLFDFMDGEVEETAEHEIHHHIDECRSCFSRVEFERVLKERVRASKEEALPDSLQGRITELMKSFGLNKMNEPDKGRK
jgi:anti-sigma factor (TIGR02949 family)